jgi:hypothetical protein
MYKLTQWNSINRLSDGVSIPIDQGNLDYQEYLKWVARGNTPLPADPKPVVVNHTAILRAKLNDLQLRTQSPTALTELIFALKEYLG